MKFRIAILILITLLLSACNFTLAEDVTPPPGYIPPTPVPTLVLVPPQKPNTANGETIYFEKCAPCHGQTGLGDGAQGIQLGVTVPAFALPEVARTASPAGWYTTVTRGKMDRFMPPFASLNDQQRWDVVAYIMTLHTNADEIQKGKEIFEANCAGCSTEYYENLGNMSGLSTVALARIIRLGNETIPAFGENLSDEDMWATAEYLRSLSYDTTPPAQPTTVPATETPASSDAESPSGEGTPVGTEQAEVTSEATPVLAEGFGSVSGSIENKTGADLPSELVITLHGYEHDFTNPNAGTTEVLTVEGKVASDGSFVFDNVEMPEKRIFLAGVTFQGMDINSEFTIVEAGQTSIVLPPLTLYEVSNDTSLLSMEELNIFLGTDSETSYEVYGLYNFMNSSDKIVSVSMGTSQEIPFLKFPTGSQALGYDAVQDSAPFTSTSDGIAMKPSAQPYGLLAVASVPKEKEVTISQPFVLPVGVVRVFVPDGMKAEGDGLKSDSTEEIQGITYQTYLAGGLGANDVLTFTISGTPKAASTGTETSSNNNALLIGAGGLGLALLLAGVWMYLRDRNRIDDEEDEDDEDEEADEFESAEDVMDAIIALDDLYRAKKITDDAYQKRRAELKEILKEMA